MWLDAYRAKGLKGIGTVFDNARRADTESFPPKSLGGSFVVVFVGSDAAIEHGIFGKIDAEEFASDAASLRAVNEVNAEAYVDEKELGHETDHCQHHYVIAASLCQRVKWSTPRFLGLSVQRR